MVKIFKLIHSKQKSYTQAMEFVENECACFKMIETHARVSSRTPADVKQVEL